MTLSQNDYKTIVKKLTKTFVYVTIRSYKRGDSMEVINISKKRFDSLEKYDLPSNIYNTEAKMYVLPLKNKWETVNKLLKRLYITSGPILGNKLQTINSLVDLKDVIGVEEIVFPEKLAVVDSKVVGYTMDLIESENLETLLSSYSVSAENKIKYLYQIGEILEKIKKVRTYTSIKTFYLNDIHEHNFIVESKTDNVRVVDIDSCKINGNYTFGSRYLTPMSILSKIPKYKQEENGICGGFYTPSEDTELYCYIIIILNTLYGGQINKLSLEELYMYLDYLSSIGVNLELLNIFEKITSNSHNENPYELLKSLIPIMPRANKHVYRKVIGK